jgi:hypothetical protein
MRKWSCREKLHESVTYVCPSPCLHSSFQAFNQDARSLLLVFVKHIIMPSACALCGQIFDTRHSYRQHKRDSPSHRNSVRCDDCPRAFLTKSELRQHKLDSPGHVAPVECHECNQPFGSQASLQQHLRDSSTHKICNTQETRSKIFAVWGGMHNFARSYGLDRESTSDFGSMRSPK